MARGLSESGVCRAMPRASCDSISTPCLALCGPSGVSPLDVSGAGDTVISALSLGLAAGLDLVQSCMLANFAAGVVVGKVGSVPCELNELIAYIQEH